MAIKATGNPFAGGIDHHVHANGHEHKRENAPEITSESSADRNHTALISRKAIELEAIRRNLYHSQEKTLWEALDEGRMEVHQFAFKNHFLMGLFKGDFCQSAFLKYLVNLLPIHEALEEAQKRLLAYEHLHVFVMSELFRSAGIKRDLVIWRFAADSKCSQWQPCKIALEYAEAIKQLSISNPERVVGVMYALYGTVMSGGQTNKLRVEAKIELIRSYMDDVPPGTGVAFYELRNGAEILNPGGVASVKRIWHDNLCLVQELLPPERRKDLKGFQSELKAEMMTAFETIMRIVETDVEPHHC